MAENKRTFAIWVQDPVDESISFEVWHEAKTYDWARVFRLILEWVGHGQEAIDDILPKQDEIWDEIVESKLVR